MFYRLYTLVLLSYRYKIVRVGYNCTYSNLYWHQLSSQCIVCIHVDYLFDYGTWWDVVARGTCTVAPRLDDDFHPEGRGFDSRSSRHVGTLGKSFTCSCLCASV